VASFYSFIVGYFVYREFKLREIIDVVYDSAIITSVTTMIIGFAQLFGWILARQQLPVKLSKIMLAISSDPQVILFVILAFLFVVGLFVEAMASKIMFIPVLFPLATMFNYNELHFAFIFHYATLLGAITPPVGLLLYISCAIGKIQVSQATIWPFIAAMVIVLILITVFPPLVLFVPRFFLGAGY
jgi:C4-dicarboxylate transporter DctM subunit